MTIYIYKCKYFKIWENTPMRFSRYTLIFAAIPSWCTRNIFVPFLQVGLFVHFLQRERGYTAMHASYNDQTTEKLVTDSFRETDAAMAQLNTWPGETQSTSLLESRWSGFLRVAAHGQGLNWWQAEPFAPWSPQRGLINFYYLLTTGWIPSSSSVPNSQLSEKNCFFWVVIFILWSH